MGQGTCPLVPKGMGKMKIFKILGIILLVICAIVVILMSASTINHKYQLRKEAKAYPPPGKLVEVNNRKMHVYGDGQGDITLVFMAGHGTSSPTIDFKPLWMRMINKYRIAVVEKAGYGWSETAASARDLDTMLDETRKALELAGEKGPYVLVPHSMSGLEAIYWAQTYPHEVKAIMGLDPTVPDFVEHSLELPRKTELYLMYLVSRIGLSRFMPRSEVEEYFPLMKSEYLSNEDKEQYLAMFYKSAYTKNMLNEVDYLQDNAKKVKANVVPMHTPMYFFISDGKEVTGSDWRELLSNYLSQINIGKYKYLDSGHYVHHEKSDIIANEMKAFIEKITAAQ